MKRESHALLVLYFSILIPHSFEILEIVLDCFMLQ